MKGSQSGLVTEALGARLKLSRQSRAIQGVGTEQQQSEWTVVPQQGPLPEEVASSHSQENSRSPDQSPPKQPLGVIFNLLLTTWFSTGVNILSHLIVFKKLE